MKACQKTIEPDIKKALSELHFSPTYEYYKLFLMYHLGGWFIESDMIFYDLNLNPKKTSPIYIIEDGLFFVSFCTWEPIFIKLDPTTKFFLKKSLETLKVYLREGLFGNTAISIPEVTYQTIFSDYSLSKNFFKENYTSYKGLNFCEYYHKIATHCAAFLLDDFDKYFNKDLSNYNDLLLARSYHEMDKGNSHSEKVIAYDDLLKFDTFKIIP